jgi:hypothetical protein
MAHAISAPAHPHGRTPTRSDSYARRRPEDTLLYQTIVEHWPAFSEHLEQHGGLPRFGWSRPACRAAGLITDPAFESSKPLSISARA